MTVIEISEQFNSYTRRHAFLRAANRRKGEGMGGGFKARSKQYCTRNSQTCIQMSYIYTILADTRFIHTVVRHEYIQMCTMQTNIRIC